ncbi:hypothetical protein POX_g09212 [Penicillium oxalicum]|uniref:hypothetical protein n=1 Tax=Penicillium oxalicum TaxID=69781 RepID=UPI0020B879FB|nr:hypothetical protein POX_g09212 [Penicillium oxalicum]KAI2786817.1 hypothetical protein POX_g09212 [Penicillium oxalicum]
MALHSLGARFFASDESSKILTETASVTTVTGCIILLAWVVIWKWQHPYKEPYFRQPRGVAAAPHLERTIMDNYEKLKNKFYRVQQPHADVLIIPPKFVDELKSHPHATFKPEGDVRFLPQYTYMGTLDGSADAAIIPAVRDVFTKHLDRIVDLMRNEAALGISIHIGFPEEWTPILPVQTMVQVVAQVAGVYVVGPASCSPRSLAVAPHFLKMRRIIKPLIDERMQLAASGKPIPRDLLALVMEHSPPHLRGDIDFQARNQLIIGMASTHTTSMTLTNALFDLAARPKYVEPLREEIFSVFGGDDITETLSKKGLLKLRKLDSFLKESARFSPLNTTSFARGLSAPITLSDGTVLPRGTHLAAAAKPLSLDPEYYDQAEIFDGFRFARLREKAGNADRYQFTSTTVEAMHFGHGKHACPGRHLADQQIKIIMIHIIRNYDIRLRDGEGRPENQVMANGPHPDLSIPILFRKRDV